MYDKPHIQLLMLKCDTQSNYISHGGLKETNGHHNRPKESEFLIAIGKVLLFKISLNFFKSP